MTKDEVLRLAFEALHYCEALNSSVEKQKMQAITAIKEALAQPEREPVECMCGLCKLGPKKDKNT